MRHQLRRRWSRLRGQPGLTGLAGLVNNAGVTIPGPLEYLALDSFRQQIEINLIGQLAVTQACLPLIRLARGRIVTISSVAGRLTMPFNGAYSAAKHALEALSDTLRLELAPWGIQVSMIQPGTIATSMGAKLQRDTEPLSPLCRRKAARATARASSSLPR